MELQIFHTVNAGLCVQTKNDAFLIDALHQGQELGFSPVPDEMYRQLQSYDRRPQKKLHLIFTHLHSDHFDPKLVRAFLDKFPETTLYGPGLFQKGIHCTDTMEGVKCLDYGSISLTAFQTLHDGKMYAGVLHNSFLLQADTRQFLICGDARLDLSLAERVKPFCLGAPVAAFANVYQLSSDAGKEFFSKIKPRHIFIYHLPFEQDDIYSYHKTARQLIIRAKRSGGWPLIDVLEPMKELYNR